MCHLCVHVLYPPIHFIYTGYWIMWIVSFSRSDHYEERGVDVKEGGGGGDDEEERIKPDRLGKVEESSC